MRISISTLHIALTVLRYLGFRLEVRLSVVAVRTLCESAADVLALVVASPEYTAVMEWLPEDGAIAGYPPTWT